MYLYIFGNLVRFQYSFIPTVISYENCKTTGFPGRAVSRFNALVRIQVLMRFNICVWRHKAEAYFLFPFL